MTISTKWLHAFENFARNMSFEAAIWIDFVVVLVVLIWSFWP
jgi:hypothetical protein